MKYDIIVIGAGIGGLVAAYKLGVQGKKVLLIERQALAGGYATVFRRKGFLFESSIHCVDSVSASGEIRKFLQDSGLDKRVEFIELNDFCRVVYPEHDFIVDFDLQHYKDTLMTYFPNEAKGINALYRQVRSFCRQFERFSNSALPDWLNFLLMPLACPLIISLSFHTIDEVIRRHVKDKRLVAIITEIWKFAGLPPSRLSALYFFIIFKGYYCTKTAYIKGGFTKLFEAMVTELRANGSEVMFNTAVTKILTSGTKVVRGVVTDKGEEILTDAVISNAPAYLTLTGMVDDKEVNNYYKEKLSGYENSISATQVYLGLKKSAKDLGMSNFMYSINTSYDHDQHFRSIEHGDYEGCSISFVDHARLDPSMAPAGKGTLLIMTLDSYSNWKDLGEASYKQKKAEVANIFIRRVEKFLPGLSENIEVMEVATPRTMERYTFSPQGAIYGFAQTVSQSGINRLPQNTPVKGLFLSGAWTAPGGGVHACFISGENVADRVIKYLAKGHQDNSSHD